MAQRINCDAIRCLHNCDHDCEAGIIQVNGKRADGIVGCVTYETILDPITMADRARDAYYGETKPVRPKRYMNMEIAKSILEAENEDGVAILCTARDCVHFREFRCDAKEIHIENHPKIGSAATRCDSYQCYQ